MPKGIQKEIKYNFNELMSLKEQGIDLFFTDVDKIKVIMYQEMQNDSLKKV